LSRLLLLLIVGLLSSCRCGTTYLPITDKLVTNADTTINAQARMWQGQYDLLGIDIEIRRSDSLFVENIKVNPSRRDAKFFPEYDYFIMHSYYNDENKTEWKNFRANTFQQLPAENRTTNRDSSYVTYTAQYKSNKPIKFESFSAEIEVLLRDTAGNTIKHKRNFDFYGERDCYISAH
jgi:hypothetical protein